MGLKLYMDQHVPRSITSGLRLRGVDVLTAFEDGANSLIQNCWIAQENWGVCCSLKIVTCSRLPLSGSKAGSHLVG